MRRLVLLALLVPLISADFYCNNTYTYKLGVQCFYQYYSTVGNNYDCTSSFVSFGSKNYLVSMEMTSIGADEVVTVSGITDTPISNNGSSLSIQQGFHNTIIAISITTGSDSKMAGILFICPVDNVDVPVVPVNVSYGQEAFVLQEFRNDGYNTGQFDVPRKWEITADSRVALISAASTVSQYNCTTDDCMQLIWIYDGIGENARFIGTAANFNNNIYFSKGKTMTLYFVAMDVGTDYMAVIANEANNLEKCSSFDAIFHYKYSHYEATLVARGNDGGGACLTILNQCLNMGECEDVQLSSAEHGSYYFYVYTGAPHPDPIGAGLVVENFTKVNTSYMIPQVFAGNIRTFYLESGNISLDFTGSSGQYPDPGRTGFLMTKSYPFSPSNDNYEADEWFFSRSSYTFNVTAMIEKTYAPPEANAYMEFILQTNTETTVQRMDFDINTNIGIPMTVPVSLHEICTIYIYGGNVTNRGTYATYLIESGGMIPTTTTTQKPTKPSTTPKSTTTTTTPRLTTTTTTPTTTTTMTTTTPLKTTTTMTTVTSTVPSTTTSVRPTTERQAVPPKVAADIYVFTVTVISILLSLV